MSDEYALYHVLGNKVFRKVLKQVAWTTAVSNVHDLDCWLNASDRYYTNQHDRTDTWQRYFALSYMCVQFMAA